MARAAPEKAVRPARIARIFPRCDLKQLCCYINPDFWLKMSDVSEHSDRDFITRKKVIIKHTENRGGHMIKCLLTELGQAGRKIFGTRSGPCAMTKCRMFSRLALPLSQ